MLKFDALAAVDGETRMTGAEAGVVASGEAEELAIEDGGGVEVGGIEADGDDAGDGRAGLGVGG